MLTLGIPRILRLARSLLFLVAQLVILPLLFCRATLSLVLLAECLGLELVPVAIEVLEPAK